MDHPAHRRHNLFKADLVACGLLPVGATLFSSPSSHAKAHKQAINAAATLACFFLSGVFHEFMNYSAGFGMNYFGWQMCFFLINGVRDSCNLHSYLLESTLGSHPSNRTLTHTHFNLRLQVGTICERGLSWPIVLPRLLRNVLVVAWFILIGSLFSVPWIDSGVASANTRVLIGRQRLTVTASFTLP